MKLRSALLAIVVAAGLVTIPGPAHAAVQRIPITCGMSLEITQDTYLYLTKNLTCSTPIGVEVRIDHDVYLPEGPPEVVVDLKGKTLRGTGSGTGVSVYDYPWGLDATVRNGTVRSWESGVFAGDDSQIRSMTLIENRFGLDCGAYDCHVDRVNFVRSSFAGLYVYWDAGAVVKRSTFIDNRRGAYSRSLAGLEFDRSTFIGNRVGAETNGWGNITASRSAFIKNKVAVRPGVHDDGWETCAALTKVLFKANGTNLDGPRC
nr:hypothetical protein [Aeromicrobium sp.]